MRTVAAARSRSTANASKPGRGHHVRLPGDVVRPAAVGADRYGAVAYPPGRVNDAVPVIPVREGPRTAAGRDAGRRIGGRWAARGIYRARRRVSGTGPAYGLVLLGDPPSFDEDDSDPHCCVKPLDAVALPSLAATAACRTRHGPPASCSAPMAPRLRCLSTVYGPGCLPGHRDYLTRHDSPGFDAGRLLRPLVPRERSRSLARPPSAVSDVHIARHRTHGASGSTRPRRPSVERHGASVPTRVHLPPQLRNTRVSRKLRFGTWASPSTSYGGAPAPDFHRPSGLTSLSGWLPTTLPQGSSHMAATIAPAPKRHQNNLVITLAAAALRADLAPRHYRIAAPGDRPRKAPSAASGHRPVVTGRCASDRARTPTAPARTSPAPAAARIPDRNVPRTAPSLPPPACFA